jgi:hypothetical protein
MRCGQAEGLPVVARGAARKRCRGFADLEGAAAYHRHDHRIGAWPATYGRGGTYLVIFVVVAGRWVPVIIAWVRGRPYSTVIAPKP